MAVSGSCILGKGKVRPGSVPESITMFISISVPISIPIYIPMPMCACVLCAVAVHNVLFLL